MNFKDTVDMLLKTENKTINEGASSYLDADECIMKANQWIWRENRDESDEEIKTKVESLQKELEKSICDLMLWWIKNPLSVNGISSHLKNFKDAYAKLNKCRDRRYLPWKGSRR